MLGNLFSSKNKKDNQEAKAAKKDNKKDNKKEKKQDNKKDNKKDTKKDDPKIITPEPKPPTPPPHKSGDEVKILELVQKVEAMELAARKSNDELNEKSNEVENLQKELNEVKEENEQLRTSQETMVKEKWELATANNELKNRLQQSMAMSYMQGGNDTMLQEELHKMQVALAEERKVTEKLSRNLELEKRRVESMEQKAKSGHRKSGGANSNSTDHNLPDSVRYRDEQLSITMEKYRIQCENLASSLEECEEKLASFEIQEDYHVADLRRELSQVKKLLEYEHKKSTIEGQRVNDLQKHFAQVLNDYNATIDHLRQAQHKKKQENQQYESAQHMDPNLQIKLNKAEEQVREERVKVKVLQDKLKQMELDVEAIPILKAQVDVYQSDFNAERSAREKIAGEKADLEEQIRKIKFKQQQLNTDIGAINGDGNPLPIGLSSVRNRVNHIDEHGFNGSQEAEVPKTIDLFQCPSCDKSFGELTPLQNHVNQCLDNGN